MKFNEVLNLINEDLLRLDKYKESNSKLIKLIMIISFFFYNGGVRTLLFYRLYRYFYIENSFLYFPVYGLSLVLCPIEISPAAIIKGGLLIPHPQCIVIGGGIIERNVSILQGVTVGLRKGLTEYPHIGENVVIGAGAKVLGNVSVGYNSKVGANAVVINDIPPNSIAVGIPAKIKSYKYGRAAYLNINKR